MYPNTSAASKQKDKKIQKLKEWFDLRYIQKNYKTNPCGLAKCKKDYSCPYYHDWNDRRRKIERHKARGCRSAFNGDVWCDPSDCPNGDFCEYFHSRMEMYYQANKYKKELCREYSKGNGSCARGMFCAFKHGTGDTFYPIKKSSPSATSIFPTNNPNSRVTFGTHSYATIASAYRPQSWTKKTESESGEIDGIVDRNLAFKSVTEPVLSVKVSDNCGQKTSEYVLRETPESSHPENDTSVSIKDDYPESDCISMQRDSTSILYKGFNQTEHEHNNRTPFFLPTFPKGLSREVSQSTLMERDCSYVPQSSAELLRCQRQKSEVVAAVPRVQTWYRPQPQLVQQSTTMPYQTRLMNQGTQLFRSSYQSMAPSKFPTKSYPCLHEYKQPHAGTSVFVPEPMYPYLHQSLASAPTPPVIIPRQMSQSRVREQKLPAPCRERKYSMLPLWMGMKGSELERLESNPNIYFQTARIDENLHLQRTNNSWPRRNSGNVISHSGMLDNSNRKQYGATFDNLPMHSFHGYHQ